MNLCESCKKFEGCKIRETHVKGGGLAGCYSADLITRADLAAKDAEWAESGLTPQNMWDEIQAIRKLVGDDGAHGSPRDVIEAKIAAKDTEMVNLLGVIRDASLNPGRTMTVIGLETSLGAIHGFAERELKNRKGAKP